VDQDVPNHHFFGRFDLNEIAHAFPETAETLLLDRYLIDEPTASTRVFRAYRATPPHYHAMSDEHLYVLRGRGTFRLGAAANVDEFAPGHLLFFRRGTVHALPSIIEGPVVFLAIDTPRREPSDIIFVDPADGLRRAYSPAELVSSVDPAVRNCGPFRFCRHGRHISCGFSLI